MIRYNCGRLNTLLLLCKNGGFSMNGIDVSYAQGSVNWARVKVAGVQFAVLRAGFGNDISQKDSCFDANMRGCMLNGITIGAYWFSYATSVADAQREARVCQQVLAPYKGKISMPIYFDYEYAALEYSKKQGIAPTKQLITDMAIAFCDAMRAAGWYSGIYTNIDFYCNRYDSRIKNYPIWLADYSGAPYCSCGIQQTGETGRVNGIGNCVDTDVCYIDYPSIIRSGGFNGYPKPVVAQYNGPATCDTTSANVRVGAVYEVQFSRCPDGKPDVTGADKADVSAPYPDPNHPGKYKVRIIGKSRGFGHLIAHFGKQSIQVNFNVK
jgi:GH25 family lysozyme M1 (1,4-beta-N-acetylmuramidase)